MYNRSKGNLWRQQYYSLFHPLFCFFLQWNMCFSSFRPSQRSSKLSTVFSLWVRANVTCEGKKRKEEPGRTVLTSLLLRVPCGVSSQLRRDRPVHLDLHCRPPVRTWLQQSSPSWGRRRLIKRQFYCVVMFHKEPRNSDTAWHHHFMDAPKFWVRREFFFFYHTNFPSFFCLLLCCFDTLYGFHGWPSSFVAFRVLLQILFGLWRCSSGRSLTLMLWMCRREGIPPNIM